MNNVTQGDNLGGDCMELDYDSWFSNHQAEGHGIKIVCPDCKKEILFAGCQYWDTVCDCGYTWTISFEKEKKEKKCYKKFIKEDASFVEYDCKSCDGYLPKSNCSGEYYMSYAEYLKKEKRDDNS